MKTARPLLAAVLLGGLPVTGCGPDVRAGSVPPEVRSAVTGTALPAAEAAAPVSEPVPPVVAPAAPATYTAVLYSDLDADVGARKDGVLVALAVELGDAVRAGQAIARLDDLREAARAESARGVLELVRAEHARAEAMRDKKVIAAADYEAVLLRLRAAEAALREAEVELELTRVVAPFDGVVTRRYGGRGRSIQEGEALYRITALQPLRALVRVPERAARALARGNPAVLRSDASDPAALIEAVIARISPAVDAGSGTVEVLLLVPRPGPLRPGSTAAVEFGGA